MTRRPIVSSVLLCMVLGLALPAMAAAPEPAAVSDALQAILDESGEDGKPVLNDRERKYFAALPEHAKRLASGAVENALISSAVHLGEILALELPNDRIELLLEDNCVLCHSNPDLHAGPTLLSNDPKAAGAPDHMNLASAVGDVHFQRGLGCAGCHGGNPEGFMEHDFPDVWPEGHELRTQDRTWIPGFCARCHSDAAFMRRFNPALPSDQLAKYETSRHGTLLLESKDSRAAQCVSCHGVHGIERVKNPRSAVFAKNVPETCGACHSNATLMANYRLDDGSPMPTNQVEEYRSSVHGRALLERGDLGAATCNDCHGNHAAMPPGVASVSQICRTCHAGNGKLFDGSRHKKEFERHGWPECGKCHGDHAIKKTTVDMVGTGEKALCPSCHAKYAKDNPECNRVAAYFHRTITQLTSSSERYQSKAHALAEKGLDVDAIEEQVVQLVDIVKRARSYIHTFDWSDFEPVVVEGTETVTKLDMLVKEADDEFLDRRVWLSSTVLMIGFLWVALYLKLRQVEGRKGDRDESR